MDPLFEKNLISTKEAGELSGYTSDYIARLARSGKISARRIGHTWFVNKESLEVFLGQQEDRKIDYARALARAREAEYRAVNSAFNRAASSLTKSLQVPEKFGGIERSVRSNVLALSVASIVVVSGAFVAQTATMPALADRVTSTASDIVYGFSETFGNIPSRVAARLEKSSSDMHASAPRVAENISRATADFASAVPNFNLSSLQMAIVDDHYALRVAHTASSAPVYVAPITTRNIQASVFGAYALVTNPSRVAGSLAHAYAALGTGAYAGIVGLLSEYRLIIDYSGVQALALATVVRDTLATAPRLISEANLALGSAIIEMAHVAIRADVSLAYAGAEAAPDSARVTVAFLGETGNILEMNVSRVPALATAFYLHATEMPSRIALPITQDLFGIEYAMAIRFVALSHAVSESYLALLTTTGSLAYAGATHSATLTHTALSLVTAVPSILEDAYLATLGKSALALDSFAGVTKVSVALPATTPLLAAVAPTLSAGEKVALATYEAINGYWIPQTRHSRFYSVHHLSSSFRGTFRDSSHNSNRLPSGLLVLASRNIS